MRTSRHARMRALHACDVLAMRGNGRTDGLTEIARMAATGLPLSNAHARVRRFDEI